MNRENLALVAAVIILTGSMLGVQAISSSTAGESVAQSASVHKVIRPENYPYFGFPYSPGILVDDTLYIAGHLGRDPVTTELVEGGLEAETRQAMANIHEVLKMTGMGFGNVVSVTVYIARIDDFPKFNEIYREYFPEDPPARATVQVAALNVGAQVELQMIAVKAK